MQPALSFAFRCAITRWLGLQKRASFRLTTAVCPQYSQTISQAGAQTCATTRVGFRFAMRRGSVTDQALTSPCALVTIIA